MDLPIVGSAGDFDRNDWTRRMVGGRSPVRLEAN